ncbi:hypothetical protein Tco_1106724 [Tanacetum coccineum]
MPISHRGDTESFPQGHPNLNEKTDLGESPKLQLIKPRPCDYLFEEWLKVKTWHTNVANSDQEKYSTNGIGKKGYILDDVWEKCGKTHGGTTYTWYDEGHEEEELWKSGIKKTEYELPMVNVETLEVKRYSFKEGRSFICITKQLDNALPLGRSSCSQFARMIRNELGTEGSAQGAM